MNNADSVKAKIRQLAVRENKPVDYLMMHYILERLLSRLSVSPYADDFVLKGGLLLYSIFEQDARATKDIDFLARHIENSLEVLKKIFVEICSLESNDPVNFDTETIEVLRIKEDADYEGVRLKIIGYLEKSKYPVQIDIGFGDLIVPGSQKMEYPSLLSSRGPVINAYSQESVISEKFEAMISLSEANSRMKDFYDIFVLSKRFDFKGDVLQEAVRQTFTRRRTRLPETPTIFVEDFKIMKDKQLQWRAFMKRIDKEDHLSFEEVVQGIANFLMPVYDAVLKNVEWNLFWDSSLLKWQK